MEDFYRKKVGETRKLRTRERILSGKVTSPVGDGRGLIRQMTSHMSIRKFQTDWFQVLLLGEAETLSKSWFGLSTSDSILGLLFFFNSSEHIHNLQKFLLPLVVPAPLYPSPGNHCSSMQFLLCGCHNYLSILLLLDIFIPSTFIPFLLLYLSIQLG